MHQLKARRDWMTYREVADALLARNRANLDVPTKSKFVQKVREAMFFQMKAGAVEREREIDIRLGDQPRTAAAIPTVPEDVPALKRAFFIDIRP